MSRSSGRDRAIRIELLRARAAIERQGMARGLQQLGDSLTPRGLLESLLPRSRRRSPSDLLLSAFTITKKYPMVLSLGSALLSATRRRRRLWKLAAGAVLAWQVSRNLRK
ncbi:MAG: hypothetical protein WCX93_09380 [Burkholderiaceae bacterium]